MQHKKDGKTEKDRPEKKNYKQTKPGQKLESDEEPHHKTSKQWKEERAHK